MQSFGRPSEGEHLISVHRETLTAQVYRLIKEKILSGQLPRGSRVNEQALSEELGVSRGSLRVAIRQLASDGLVDLYPFKGAYVRPLTERDIQETYEIRFLVESFAARKGMPVSKETFQLLEEAAQGNFNEVVAGNRSAAAEWDLRFHQTLVGLTQNRRLMETWEAFYRDIMGVLVLATNPATAQRAYQQHMAIARALLGNGVAAAMQAIEQHLHDSLASSLEALPKRLTTE